MTKRREFSQLKIPGATTLKDEDLFTAENISHKLCDVKDENFHS